MLGAALQAVGFEVSTRLDADEDALYDALDDFEAKIAAETGAGEQVVAFFYYSGHGASTMDRGRRRNYLIPAKAEVTTASQLIRRGAPLDEIIGGLAASGAQAIFVVSDACRNDLAPAFSRGSDKGFAPVVSRPGMFIASSTFPGETAPDDGVFADALAENIRTPSQFASRAFELAFRRVASTRAGYELPTVANALREDFCFNGCPSAGARPAPSVGDPGRPPVEQLGAEEALAQLKQLAESGDVNAMRDLGLLMADPESAVFDPRAALGWFERAAEQGDAEASFRAGRAYQNGEGVAKDTRKAAAFYGLAVERGSTEAMNNLAVLLTYGDDGATKDPARGRALLERAVEAGGASAAYNLAAIHDDGVETPPDPDKAAAFMIEALRLGSEPAREQMIAGAKQWSRAFRIALQRALAKTSVDPGPADGVFGSRTRASIEALAAGGR